MNLLKINPYILGDVEPALFIAACFFAAVGIAIVLLIGTRLRDKNGDTAPEKFSWRYLWSDNAKRLYASALATLIALRFMPEVLNIKLSPWMGFVTGTFWDTILLIVKQKTSLLDPKPKAPQP